MKAHRKDAGAHDEAGLIAGFLGAALLTIPLIIRLGYGDGTTWDWIFLVLGVMVAGYWIMLAFQGRNVRRRERADLERE